MSLWKKIYLHLNENWQLYSYPVLLVMAFVAFIYFQAVPSFADPDSFYHIKMSLLIPKLGIIKAFPWLQFTILKDAFIDQHFLYHVFMIPFTQLMDPLQGGKMAQVALDAGLVMIFYWFLRRYKVKFAFALTLVLLLTMPLMFRINLVKAPVFSMIFLLLGLHFIFQYKYKSLFLLSVIYVWAYGGFILILVFAGIYALVSTLLSWWRQKGLGLFEVISHSREVRLFLVVILGILVGILVNPQFPQNVVFYWHQLVKIGIINYQSVIPVGNEWYPYKFPNLMASTALLSILLLVSYYFLAVNIRRPSKKIITLFIIYLFFFAFTLKSQRYVEYYVPFALLFCCFSLNQFFSRLNWRDIWSKSFTFYKKHSILATILLVYFLAAVPTVMIKDFGGTYRDLKNGIRLDRFAGVCGWLETYAPAGQTVFHSSWDEFPMLFYFNDQNYYIAGLDPTFTYEYDQDLYKKMVDITVGNQKDNLYEDIKVSFHSSYVLVEKNHQAMDGNIRADSRFVQVYTDGDATLYQVM